MTDPGDTDVRMQLNSYGHIGPVRLGAGWLGRRVDTVSPATPDVRSNLYYLTAVHDASAALVVDGGVYRIINRENDTRGTIAAVRTAYLLSKRSAVYLQGAYLFNSAHAAYTVSQGGGGTTARGGHGTAWRHDGHKTLVLIVNTATRCAQPGVAARQRRHTPYPKHRRIFAMAPGVVA